MDIVSRLEIQLGAGATHILKSQEQVLSAGYKHRKSLKSLTTWT